MSEEFLFAFDDNNADLTHFYQKTKSTNEIAHETIDFETRWKMAEKKLEHIKSEYECKINQLYLRIHELEEMNNRLKLSAALESSRSIDSDTDATHQYGDDSETLSQDLQHEITPDPTNDEYDALKNITSEYSLSESASTRAFTENVPSHSHIPPTTAKRGHKYKRKSKNMDDILYDYRTSKSPQSRRKMVKQKSRRQRSILHLFSMGKTKKNISKKRRNICFNSYQ